MSFNTYQHYTFDTDPLTDHQSDPEIMLRQLQNQLQSHQSCTKFLTLLSNFNLSILNQFICAVCAFCGRLIYPEKCEWLPYDENFSYPLLQAYPETEPKSLLTFHIKPPRRIAVYLS
ncbi:1386_t:CDS:2, partial [Rhizophagus irregularis]